MYFADVLCLVQTVVLSAGKTTRSLLVLKEVRAVLFSLDRLCFRGRAECRILAVSNRMDSAFSLGRFLMEVSTALIICSVGIFSGVVAKLRPFDKSVFSDSERG